MTCQATSPYCDADAYVQQFGMTETAMLLQDEARLLEVDGLRAALSDNPADFAALSLEMQVVVQSVLNRLNEALRRTALFMDGYLRGVVALPLTLEQSELTDLVTCNAELARCWLMDDTDNATDLAEKRCATWRTWLRDVAARRVVLFPTAIDGTNSAKAVGKTRHGVGASRLNWQNYP